jgi:hypothetical protein
METLFMMEVSKLTEPVYSVTEIRRMLRHNGIN